MSKAGGSEVVGPDGANDWSARAASFSIFGQTAAQIVPGKQSESVDIFVFVMMLDVLSHYLRAARARSLDGGVTGRDRQKQIDQFAQQGPEAVRVMLLPRGPAAPASTPGLHTSRFMTDLNPQNDVQAMARRYRIGQTRKVTVYRLLTAGTYEAHAAVAKLSLDRAVLMAVSANAGNRHLHESL